MRAFGVAAMVGCVLLGSCLERAHAQPRQGALRVAVDVDVVSLGYTKLRPEGAPTRRHVTVGLGPSQLGASELGLPSATLGVGVGYAVAQRWLIGARAGFGYDRVSASASEPAASYLTWTFMPGVWYLPYRTYFVVFSPLLEYTRREQAEVRQTRFGGCFSIGGGSLLFVAPGASVDVGLYFEGRFPDIEERPQHRTEISDLRWLLRVGLSIWR